jgi:hypothetical protein
MRRLLQQVLFYVHHVWLLTAALAVYELVQLADLSSLDRTSLANNQRFLEIIEDSYGVAVFGLVFMMISLYVWRRRLKRSVLRRLGARWQRIIFGLQVPFAVPFFWMRDVERLAKAPRDGTTTKQSLRTWRPTKTTYLWLLFVLAWARVSTPLDYAGLGITYVTEGTSALDDPLRYALKWIEPAKITGALDEYSKYIWLGCVANCAILVVFSLVSWQQMQRLSRLSKAALS